MRTLVIGDIHGNHKGLVQALARAEFDYEKDRLISLGDVIDGHAESYEVVEELLKVKNLIAVKGNHDDWFHTWLVTGNNPSLWMQGQDKTAESYIRQIDPENPHMWDYSTGIARPRINSLYIPDSHYKFFNEQRPYYIDDKDRLFIHGGFNRHFRLEEQREYIFWWDRDLWSQALSWESMGNMEGLGKPEFKMKEEFTEIFIGHTPTMMWKTDQPMHANIIWNLDTGGGWAGRITVMDVDTKEFWQSDLGTELYPDFKGR